MIKTSVNPKNKKQIWRSDEGRTSTWQDETADQ